MFAYLFDVTRKFFRASGVNKRHIVFVVLASAWFRFAQVCLPFRWVSHQLGTQQGKVQFCTIVTATQLHRAIKTGHFIENVCNRTPWKAECMIKAQILRRYLDRYQIPYVLHLGLAKKKESPEGKLLAHAWVNVGPYAVVGGEGHQQFAIISSYVSRSLNSLEFA